MLQWPQSIRIQVIILVDFLHILLHHHLRIINPYGLVGEEEVDGVG